MSMFLRDSSLGRMRQSVSIVMVREGEEEEEGAIEQSSLVSVPETL